MKKFELVLIVFMLFKCSLMAYDVLNLNRYSAGKTNNLNKGVLTFADKETKCYLEMIEAPYLIVSPLSNDVTWEAGEITISVSSNLDWNFAIHCECSWIRAVKVNQTTLTVSYDENENTCRRNVNIYVYAGASLSEYVYVNQEFNPLLCVDEFETNNKISTANKTAFNILDRMSSLQTISATLNTDKDIDYYKLSIRNAGILNVVLTPPFVDETYWAVYDIELLDNLGSRRGKYKYSDYSDTITYNILRPGYYYIKAYNGALAGGYCEEYTIETIWTPSLVLRPLDITKLSIYPVPVGDEMNIRLNSEINGSVIVQILDINGNLLMSKEIKDFQNLVTLDVSIFKQGNYLVKLITQDMVYTEKWTKQ